MSVTRVRTSSGWVDLSATGDVGATGPSGPTGPTGIDGAVELYEQPSAPASPGVGAIWIDTDESPGVIAYQQFTQGTTFPASPNNGDVHVYPCDAIVTVPTNAGGGCSWQFIYVSSVNEWRYIGGAPVTVYDADQRTINSTTTPAPAVPTDPMSITVPFKGDWDAHGSASTFDQTGGGFNGINWGYQVGGVTGFSAFVGWGGNQWIGSIHTTRRRHALLAGAVFEERARVSAGGGTVQDRAITVWPVRYTP